MGLINSKIAKPVTEKQFTSCSAPTSPISTPETSRKGLVDPRSPSTNISRTPLELDSFTIEENEIESGEVFYSPIKEEAIKYGIDPRSPTVAFMRTPLVLNTSKNNLFLDTSASSINLGDVSNNELNVDPRSPTTEFTRTPIIVKSSEDNLIKKIHKKNLGRVINSEILHTPTGKKEVIAPKLLESSPIKPRSDAYKRKSFVGLLETNIDYTETDIDAVLREKCRINDCETGEIFSEAITKEIDNGTLMTASEMFDEPNLTENNNESVEDDKIPENSDNIDDTCPPPDTKENKEVTTKSIEETCDAAKHVGEVDEVKEDTIENGPGTNETNDSFKGANAKKVEDEVHEAPETLQETKSAPLTPRIKAVCSRLNAESKSAPETPPVVNLTADVKELDKKLTNLIYEDQDIVVCPRIVHLKDIIDRSPLRNRNTSQSELRKSAQKLKVSDKPRKSDYAVSKIPVFKSKGKNQCENTPPRNVERKGKVGKKTQWDNNDVTLYL